MKKLFVLTFVLLLLLCACGKKEPENQEQENPENIESTIPEDGSQSENTEPEAAPETQIVPIDFTASFDPSGLSTEKFEFSYGIAKDGEPHFITVDNQTKFDDWKVNTLAWDN